MKVLMFSFATIYKNNIFHVTYLSFTLLYNLEQVQDVLVSLDKTDFMCFNQDDTVFSLNGKHLKFVDHFIYLDNNISSTEIDVNIHIGKAWTTIDRLKTIRESDL